LLFKFYISRFISLRSVALASSRPRILLPYYFLVWNWRAPNTRLLITLWTIS